MKERKEMLSILRKMWLDGDSPLHRIYPSWEELELNIRFEESPKQTKSGLCPYCGTKQEISKLIEGIFPYQRCEKCKESFYVHNDFTVRKLTQEEEREIPNEWIQVVEDLQKKRTALVFRIE